MKLSVPTQQRRISLLDAETKLRYLIMSQPRTGSSLICSALRNSGIAGQPTEYFNPNRLKSLPRPLTSDAFWSFYNSIVAEGTSSNGVFGIKLHFGQFKSLFVQNNRVTDDGVLFLKSFHRTILISREDKIAQAISHLLAKQHEKWNSSQKTDEGNQNLEFKSSHVPSILMYLTKSVSENTAWHELCEQLKLDPLRLTYEQIVDNPQQEIGRVLLHLGLPPGEFLPDTLRLSRDGHSEAKMAFLREIGAL